MIGINRTGDVITIELQRPERRNAPSLGSPGGRIDLLFALWGLRWQAPMHSEVLCL